MLKKIATFPEKKEIVRRLTFATNKYIKKGTDGEDLKIPITNFVLKQKRKTYLAFLTSISKECKLIEQQMKDKEEKAAIASCSDYTSKKTVFIPKLTFRKSNL